MTARDATLPFDELGRLPDPRDNVAIATRRLDAGTQFAFGGSNFEIEHTVLESRRFAIEKVLEGGEFRRSRYEKRSRSLLPNRSTIEGPPVER